MMKFAWTGWSSRGQGGQKGVFLNKVFSLGSRDVFPGCSS